MLAAACSLGCAAAFLLLPWTTGDGPFTGREFTGRGLASIVRNTDVLIGGSLGTPVARTAGIALALVPAGVIAGAVLVLGAHWAGGRGAHRLAAAANLISALVIAVIAVVIAAGPAAGDYLHRTPEPGMLLSLVLAAVAAVLSAWA